MEYELKYPQQFSQAPCLRPIIKLELMETISLHAIEERSIQSLVSELYQQSREVNAFACVSIQATLVEKVLSMLRRTMPKYRRRRCGDFESWWTPARSRTDAIGSTAGDCRCRWR